jgi:quercetin dioxygenase-like cupin family protein
MNRTTPHLAILFAFTLLVGLAPGAATFAQPEPTPGPLVAPPGPVSQFPTRFDVLDAPEQFDRVLMVIDFPGGAWTPSHTPGGHLYVTVIEGDISTRTAGAAGHDDSYPAGSAFTVNPGEYLKLGNATTANARVIATALLPKYAPLTIDQAGLSSDAYSVPTDGLASALSVTYGALDSFARVPHPTTVYRSSMAVERPAGAFELVHMLLDFDPGVWTPQHVHGGQELAMPIAGELTLQRHGDVQTFAPGESWINTSGLVHAAGNEGKSVARAVATYLLPAGTPLTALAAR